MLKARALFVLSALILFAGFFADLWQVAELRWWGFHQRDMESFIVGRMVKSRQDGIFSQGGLTGFGCPDRECGEHFFRDDLLYQYNTYVNDRPFGGYSPYMSQIGGQGILFSLLDRLLLLSSDAKLRFFWGLTSLLSASILASIVLWFYREFGLSAALFVLASAIFSQWMTIFGRNLWWSLWAFYLPMTVMMYVLRRNSDIMRVQTAKLAMTVFAAIFIKCLFNGYEYITTSLIMMMVPFFYYGILAKWNFRELLRGFAMAIFGASCAMALTLCILLLQIASVKGDLTSGIDHVVSALKKRSHANPQDFSPELTEALEASMSSVVAEYLNGAFFDIDESNIHGYIDIPDGTRSSAFWALLKVRYSHLIFLFFLISLWILLRKKRHTHSRHKKNIALISATWLSIFAPLSWFVVFKAHSSIHTHMNFIAWQMPFTLFGFAICGLACRDFFLAVGSRWIPVGSSVDRTDP